MSVLPEKIDLTMVPRWVIEKYPERQQDMESWLVSYYFWFRWKDYPEQDLLTLLEDVKLEARAVAEAKLAALDNVLELQEVSEQTAMSMLVDANTEDWYQYAEVKDLIEFLHDKMDQYMDSYRARKAQNPKAQIPGSVYEIGATIQVVTTLAKMGVPKSDIISFRPNLSKAKYGASELKSVIASDLPEEEKQHKVMEIMGQISNPNVSVDTFLENKKRRSFEASKGDLPIDGSIVVLPQGELIQIRSPKTSTTRAIQFQLRGIVDGWNQVDAVELATQLTDAVYTKNKYRPTRLHDDRLIQGGEGIMMPTPSRFIELCWIQLGRTSRYLSEIMSLTPDGSASMTIFEIGIKCRTKEELEKHLKEQFRTSVLGITMSLETAIRNFYKVPEEIEALFDRVDLQVWWRQNSALEVRLICMQSDGSMILDVFESSGEEEMQFSG